MMERSDDVLIGGSNTSLTNGDINAVMSSSSLNNNNNSTNPQTGTGTTTTSSNNSERSANSYTMPGILHFLQHEWNRFEFERQQWEVDRAELMSKISFLQGERRGQENLKNNLIRRIKMLELALKQERIKYHKLKYGVEPSPLNTSTSNEPKSNNTNSNQSNENNDSNEHETSTFSISQHPILNKENSTNSSNTIKQGRQLLKQYLQEIGYTDTIIDVRSARLRALLGLKSTQNQQNNDQSSADLLTSIDPLSNLLNGNKQLLQLSINNNNSNNSNKRALSSSSSSNSSLNNSNNSNAITSINTNSINGNLNSNEVQKILKLTASGAEADLDQFNQTSINSNSANLNQNNNLDTNSSGIFDDDEMTDDEKTSNGDSSSIQQINDLDTEDALKEFSFLSSAENNSDMDSNTDWNVDKAQLNKLTEDYKKERKSKSNKNQQQSQHQQQNTANAQRPNRSTLQAMIANLTESSNSPICIDSSHNNSGSTVNILGAKTVKNNLDLSPNSSQKANNNNVKFNSSGNSPKLFNLEDENFASDASLGELSRISVNNSINLSGLNDETVVDSSRKTISNKHSLRGHFDSIRCLAFHPTESVLLSGSEDQTIKLWNLDKSSLNSKKNTNTDIEPIYTFRKHTGPVLSLLVSPNGDHCISSGLDSKIIIWNMPNHENTDQYDAYSSSIFVKFLKGHTDAVWNMCLVDNTLVSVSADSTIRIWNPFSIDDLNEASSSSISCLNENKSEGVPSSVDFINNEKSKIITSFGSSHHNLYDIETSKIISRFDYFDSTINTHCYKVISHPTSASTNSSLILSAHEDKKIRFFDINSGKLVYQMVAHQDACTDLAIDPTCFYLLSSSHDCSIRLWNLENKNCIQEMTSHRKKYDESINCVAFHSSKPFIASGGADAIVKIYV